MKKVLITGATGFIAKHLIPYLHEQGYQLRVLTRQAYNNQQMPLLETIIGDITQPQSLMGACDGIDIVFHLAGYAHATQNRESAELHQQINFLGTQNIYREAKRAGVKSFIYFSSVKASDAEANLDHSPYAKAKYAAEKYLLACAEASLANTNSHKIHIAILRPALIYGVGWKGNLAAMLKAIDSKRFPSLPETHNRRSMVSARDVSRAADLISANPLTHGKIYTVTDGIDYSTRQIYTLMCAALGVKAQRFYLPLTFFRLLASIGNLLTRVTRKRMPFNAEVYDKLFGSAWYDGQALHDELGFIPHDELKQLLPAIVADYRQGKVDYNAKPSA